MLRFKFRQNRSINEDFYFWGGKILSENAEENGGTCFQKFVKTSYRMVVPTDTKNFSILVQLEGV